MSGRDLTAEVAAELASAGLAYLMFCRLDFDSGSVYVTSLPYSIDWDGHTWVGLGNLGSVEEITEGEAIEAYGIALTLSGIESGYMSILIGEQYQGRRVRLWFGALDADHQVVPDPVLVFKGRMDVPEIDLGSVATIKVKCEGRLADLDRARSRRFNNADQQAVYPGDKGFEYAEAMVEKQLYWGLTTPAGVGN